MAVYGDVDTILFQRADVDHGLPALADTEERVGRNVGVNNRTENEGQASAQELLHDVLPVTVGGFTGVMHGLEDFVIG